MHARPLPMGTGARRGASLPQLPWDGATSGTAGGRRDLKSHLVRTVGLIEASCMTSDRGWPLSLLLLICEEHSGALLPEW